MISIRTDAAAWEAKCRVPTNLEKSYIVCCRKRRRVEERLWKSTPVNCIGVSATILARITACRCIPSFPERLGRAKAIRENKYLDRDWREVKCLTQSIAVKLTRTRSTKTGAASCATPR